MAYATIDDVLFELGKHAPALTATSKPSQADVTGKILPDVAGAIDAILSARGLVVPVAAPPSFLERLRALNAIGAAARVDAALFPQAGGPASTSFATWLKELYDDGIVSLRDGEGIPDGLASAGTSLPTSFWSSHAGSKGTDLDNATVGNTTDPTFRRDSQW